MADVDDPMQLRVSTELDSPPPINPMIETDTEAKAEDLPPPPGSFYFRGKLLRAEGEIGDPERRRQYEIFARQFKESEGFDVDWDSCDYIFSVLNFYWQPYLDDKLTNDELLKLLIRRAIEEHNDEYETALEFVYYVGANIVPCKGLMYYITFCAKDFSSSPNPELKTLLYQAKVWKFCDEIRVKMVREKPTQ